MKYLITGGCGFIGTNLVSALITANSNNQLRIVDNFAVGSREDLLLMVKGCQFEAENMDRWGGPGAVQVFEGDIMDAELALKVSYGADAIIHLAANTGVFPSIKDPVFDCHTNVLGTINYLEAARKAKVPRFVFASSGAPVGECEPPIHENKVPRPVSPYGASKLAGEGYCSAYFASFDIETVVLRFSNVYGPGSKHKESFIAKCIKRLLKGELIEIYGDGQQTRDFLYIDDLVQAIILAAISNNLGGEIFQIATGKETAISDVVSLLTENFKKCQLPVVKTTYSEMRKGDVKRNYSDITKARNVLGWHANQDLIEGLEKTLDYFVT